MTRNRGWLENNERLKASEKWWSRVAASAETRVWLALLFVLLLGVIFNADGAFFRITTHRDALRQASVYGILACGMTLVIITGGIDLAVGSILALVAVSFSMMTIRWGWPAAVAIPLAWRSGWRAGPVRGRW